MGARNPKHNETVTKVKNHFLKHGYTSRKSTNLPTDGTRDIIGYQPDAIFEKNGKMKWIFEVDTNYTSPKYVVGGIFMANLCLDIEFPNSKPNILYVLLNRTTPERLKKLKFLMHTYAEQYFHNLSQIIIEDEPGLNKFLSKDIL